MVLGDQNQAAVQTFSSPTCSITLKGDGTATYISSGCPSVQSRRPITNFAGIEVATGVGYSNYNALEFKAEDMNRSNSTFGSIKSAFPARQLQVAAKLIF
jgi:hypothetical protein